MSANPDPTNLPLLNSVADRFRAAGVKLAVVESCTGGGLGYALTSLPGSSEWFEGGFITYSNALKTRSVYVRESTLAEKGAVSEECVKEMANGGMVAMNVHCCVSISGVAGPDGGSEAKPVGTVWMGLAVRHKSIESYHFLFEGDREAVRQQAITEALKILSQVTFKK